MSRVASSAVLQRESQRSSRRWQTYALRMGFTAAMLTLLLAGVQTATALGDPSNLAYFGRGIYVVFGLIQLVFTGLLAAVFGAGAVQDERDDGTLEMLILTRLTAGQVLRGKLVSRLLVLLTVAVGSLPVLSLLTTVGGVSVIEVVALTVHTAVIIAVMGVTSAFFALFTRSTLLAATAAVTYGIVFFLFAPTVYVVMTGDPKGWAHVSPLFGPISFDGWALMPALVWAPSIGLLLNLGSRLFDLTSTQADVRRLYATRVWGVAAVGKAALVLLLSGVVVIPVGTTLSWGIRVVTQWGSSPMAGPWDDLGLAAAILLLLAWLSFAIALSTWVFAHLGVDLVLTLDALGRSLFRRASRRRRTPANLRVWANPIAWRETRWRAASRVLAPAAGIWLLAMLVLAQTGVWLIPGGLVGIGLLNASLGLVITVWLSVRTIDRERRDGTLDLLRTTTLSPVRILLGKVYAVGLPGLVLMVVAIPLTVLGMPYLGAVLDDHGVAAMTLRGVATIAWLLPVWLLFLEASMVLAIRVRNPRSAYAPAFALLAVGFVLPGLGALVLRTVPVVPDVLQTVVPVFTWDAAWWQYLLSGSVAAFLVLALAPWLVLQLRSSGRFRAR